MEIRPTLMMTSMTQPGQANARTTSIMTEIQPGPNNVDSGDRSANTVEISITTPNREASATISREQVVDSLDTRLQQQALGQPSGNNPAINPGTLQALQQSDANTEALANVAILQQQRQLANTYQDAASSNAGQSNNPPANNPANGVNLYNNAIDAYVQQTLFFSTLDRAQNSFSTMA